MQIRVVLLLSLTALPFWGLALLQTAPPAISSKAVDILFHTFNSPDCSNPCWLGIEVGVTDEASAIAILEEHGVDFTPEVYSGGSIWLYHIPDGLFPKVAPQEFTRGDINVSGNDIVDLMIFEMDICISTILAAYGLPDMWHSILVYPEHQLFFTVDETTQRTDLVILQMEAAMPPAEEMEKLSRDAYVLEDDCSDVFTEYDR